MKRIKLWLYMLLHQYDDYSVRATLNSDIRENIHAHSTPWLLKAIVLYIYFNFKYPNCTIVFTHFRYEKENKDE